VSPSSNCSVTHSLPPPPPSLSGINYTHEKLKNYYHFMVFEKEQILYRQEGLRLSSTFSPKYLENSNQIDFFENPVTGLFTILNEHTTLTMKQGDTSRTREADQKFLTSLSDKNKMNPCFEVSEDLMKESQFILHHYTIPVRYRVENLLERNKGIREINFTTLSTKNNQQVVYSTDNSLKPAAKPDVVLPTIQSSRTLASGGSTTRTSTIQTTIRNKTKTICSVYHSEVCDLLVKLQETRSHFVICLKPNDQSLPLRYDVPLMKQQIQSYSLLETCLVTSNFISRQLSFSTFFQKYRVLLYPLGVSSWTKSIFQFLHSTTGDGTPKRGMNSPHGSDEKEEEKEKVVISEESYRSAVLSFIDLIPITQLILNRLYPPSEDEDELKGGGSGGDEGARSALHHHRSNLQIFSNYLKVGHSSVFLLSNIYDLLERLYYLTTDLIARKLQRIWKLHRAQEDPSPQRILIRSMRYFNHFHFLKVRDTTLAAILIQRKYRQHRERSRYLVERLSLRLPRGMMVITAPAAVLEGENVLSCEIVMRAKAMGPQSNGTETDTGTGTEMIKKKTHRSSVSFWDTLMPEEEKRGKGDPETTRREEKEDNPSEGIKNEEMYSLESGEKVLEQQVTDAHESNLVIGSEPIAKVSMKGETAQPPAASASDGDASRSSIHDPSPQSTLLPSLAPQLTGSSKEGIDCQSHSPLHPSPSSSSETSLLLPLLHGPESPTSTQKSSCCCSCSCSCTIS
jgi:hypothetical protein